MSLRAIELARSVPPSLATCRVIAGHARHLVVVEGASSEGIELAREALTLSNEFGDNEFAIHSLNTLGLGRVQAGDAGGIDDLEQAVERGRRTGAVSAQTVALNNLANGLWRIGRLDDAAARLTEAQELNERYGITAGLHWNKGEWVYEHDYRGDLEGAIAAATHYLSLPDAADSYQHRPVLATRARALLVRGQVDEAIADIEPALASFRDSGYDAQIAGGMLTVASLCLRAAGRGKEADDLLAEALTVEYDELVYDLPLELVELGRGDEYLALTEGKPGYVWQEAGRAAASGDLVGASEIYGRIGARFSEAWAALLAAERGDASRLDAALAYFEEQRATPYVTRCRALMQASA